MVDKTVTRTASGGVKASMNRDSTSAKGLPGEPKVVNKAGAFAMRALTGLISRLQLASKAGLQFGGKRDLYQVFGYQSQLTSDDFLGKYIRQDVASRVVDAPPAATWSNPPEFAEDETFKAAWDEANKQNRIFNACYRADRLARLNHFSVMLFGLNDSSSLARPASTSDELLYVHAFGARQVRDVEFNTDPRDPRFGLPEKYIVQFDDPTQKSILGGTISTKGTREFEVHWSRTVHIVENPLEDTVFGIPIMEKVYNLLDDLLKVSGGTAETYWLTANRGIQADIDKDLEIDPEDAAALADEIEEYQHELRRIIRTRGVDLNVLESKPPNPKEVFDMLIALLSGTTGIPRRILLGAEAGQLASEQDRANWAERIGERRILFAQPGILEPVIDRLQSVGLLPEEVPEIMWPSAFILSPLEASMVEAQKARAIGNISRQTGNKAPMQLTSREEARAIIGLEGDLPESEIIEPPEEETGGFGQGVQQDEDTPPNPEER